MMEHSLTDAITAGDKTHLIFDFDATLFFMDIPWHEWGDAIRGELQALGVELWPPHEFRGGAGYQNTLVETYGDSALAIVQRHAPLFEMSYWSTFQANEELLKEVDVLRENRHMFIWSSNSHALVDKVFQETDMSNWFEKIVSRNEVRFLKPSSEGFNYIYDPRIPKERYIFIGNSRNDRKAAAEAGIDFYLIDFFNQGR
ncbi:MAG TPA: HAD hydrolase-like protein [Patescibacteria group bacterium]|nr:HAD hydrolase-like protein [Patescibacteria group bacterium]